MPSFTVTYKDNDTDPDLIEQIAKHHGISPEMLIKRFIGEGIEKHCPADFDIADCENISDFMTKGGYRK